MLWGWVQANLLTWSLFSHMTRHPTPIPSVRQWMTPAQRRSSGQLPSSTWLPCLCSCERHKWDLFSWIMDPMEMEIPHTWNLHTSRKLLEPLALQKQWPWDSRQETANDFLRAALCPVPNRSSGRFFKGAILMGSSGSLEEFSFRIHHLEALREERYLVSLRAFFLQDKCHSNHHDRVNSGKHNDHSSLYHLGFWTANHLILKIRVRWYHRIHKTIACFSNMHAW